MQQTSADAVSSSNAAKLFRNSEVFFQNETAGDRVALGTIWMKLKSTFGFFMRRPGLNSLFC